jgi:hypothetical protein
VRLVAWGSFAAARHLPPALSAQNRLDYERLCRRIEEYGVKPLLETASPSDEWHERTVARFNAARDEEYQEVVDEAERVREEIERERRKGKFTFAELEDVESQLERVRKYLGKAEARDVFGAAGHAQAVAATDESGRVRSLCAAGLRMSAG